MNRTLTVLGPLVAAAALSLTVAGCGKSDQSSATTPGSTKPAAGTSTGVASGAGSKPTDSGAALAERNMAAKMNAYTEGYNRLIGRVGLSETQERYVRENISKRKASESVSISNGWIDLALEALMKARALPGDGLGEVDRSADVLIAALDPLVKRLKALNVYYDSKAYKEDNLARGKAEDPLVLAGFEETARAERGFNEVFSRELKKRDAVMLEKMKASGDVLGYNTKIELQLAEEVVNLFGTAADVRDAGKYTTADAVVAKLERTLEEQRKAIEEAKSKGSNPDSGHDSAVGRLVSFVGTYRDMKQSKQPENANKLIKDYNEAVESANRIRR